MRDYRFGPLAPILYADTGSLLARSCRCTPRSRPSSRVLCAGTTAATVSVFRERMGRGRFYISPIFQCSGYSVIFADPDKFMQAVVSHKS